MASALAVAAAPLADMVGAQEIGSAPTQQSAPRSTIAPVADQGALLDPLMTAAERQRWGRLRADAGRSDFVEEFWDARDPTPGTVENERRQVFEKRAQRAIDEFTDEAEPGYATDRGRVLLVYGLPDEQETRALPGAQPTLTWRYTRHVPPFVAVFGLTDAGYVLEQTPELSDAAFLRGMGDDLRLLLATSVGDRNGSLVQPLAPILDPLDPMTAFAAGPPPAPPPEVAPEVQVWMELVYSGKTRDDLTLRRRIHFFPALEGTYTTITFALDKGELLFEVPVPLIAPIPGVSPVDLEAGADAADPEAALAADAAPTIAPVVPVIVEDLLEPRADLRIFGAFLQGEAGRENTMHSFIVPYALLESYGGELATGALSLGVTLFPGTYRLVWGVMDAGSARAVTRDEVVQIPDFSEGELALTRPLLASAELRDDFRPMDTLTVYEGLRLGNVLVANSVDDLFGRADTVEVVVVATGWASDPASPGKPRLEVVYRVLEGLEGEESLARLPDQVLDFHVLGQQIPLAQIDAIRAGRSYRIEVQVTDLVTGAQTVQRVPIHLRRRAREPDEDQ